MGSLNFKFRELVAPIALLALALSGCAGGGDTDGGAAVDNAANFGNDAYVNDDSAGRIELEVNEKELQVSRTTEFVVTVFDSNGVGVPHIQVACDSESGIGIIEPTTGNFYTNERGGASGVIGCEVPGSLLFGCRLPVGGNKRKFVTLRCLGPVPTGFTGFPGATGGSLGSGGVGTNDDGSVGGTDTENAVRITRIQAVDEGGSTATTSIDVAQIADCDPSDTDPSDPEPFFDTSFNISVVNNSNSIVRFTKMTVTVPNATGVGTPSVKSPSISLIGEALPKGDSVDFNGVLVFKAGTGGGKSVSGSSQSLSAGLIRNVTVTLFGTNDLGEDVVISGGTALGFDNYDRCS